MSKHTILRPAYPPDLCYLSEVLYWRAFGRFPEQQWDDDGKPWRTSDDIRDSTAAPIPESLELEEEECKFAGIPLDPGMQALLDDNYVGSPEIYQRILSSPDTLDPDFKKELEEGLKKSLLREAEIANWQILFDEYVDQYRNEICLDLKRGRLLSYGTELPHPDLDEAIAGLEAQEKWFNDLSECKIPRDYWILGNINWEESTLFGRERSFIWVNISVVDMLELYPPEILIKSSNAFSIGTSVAVVSGAISKDISKKRTGRPPLPWSDFHVEVARMYKDGEMPEKKEAAIATLQEWFYRSTGQSASPTAVGDKLTPYFQSFSSKDGK